ncbi:MAG: glycosyltransferase [Deltaproteobacteria bacterium]|nr:glycosyltransferase [Deltaproteobacteria bacterium]
MRVLGLVQQPALRGAEVFAAQLAETLRDAGHDARTLFLYDGRGAAPPLAPGDLCLHGDPGAPLERVFVGPATFRRLTRAVADAEPDVLLLHGARTLKYGALLSRVTPRRRFAAIYRNIGNPTDWLRAPLRRAAYRGVIYGALDGVVALSETSQRALRDELGVRAPVEVIPNGVSPAALAPRKPRGALREQLLTPEDAPVALFVGSLSREKRVDRLLRAFALTRAEAPEAHLWIVGEGPLRSELQALAGTLALGAAVTFCGSTSDIGSYYAAADVLALSSDTEGIPGVVLEAGHAGLPVVSTDVGSVRAAVTDGETGVLVPRDDEAALARALTALFRDRAARARLGGQAAVRVAREFTMDRIAARYLTFFERCRAERHRSA